MAGGDGHDRSSALRLRLTGLVPRPNSAALVRPCAAGSAEALGSALGTALLTPAAELSLGSVAVAEATGRQAGPCPGVRNPPFSLGI